MKESNLSFPTHVAQAIFQLKSYENMVLETKNQQRHITILKSKDLKHSKAFHIFYDPNRFSS